MEWISDPIERQKIIAKLRRPRWAGFFDETDAQSIFVKYQFRDEFNLADKLSEAVWRYQVFNDRRQKPFTQEELATGEIASIETAIHLGLWKAHNQRTHQQRTQAGRVSAAAKFFRNSNRKLGRPTDLRMVSFLRTLGAIYEDGTGNKPAITRSPGKGFRGSAYRFAVDVCLAARINLSEHHLREMEFRRRKRLEPKKTTSIDKLLIGWSNKKT
jgi:hypothetical protein